MNKAISVAYCLLGLSIVGCGSSAKKSSSNEFRANARRDSAESTKDAKESTAKEATVSPPAATIASAQPPRIVNASIVSPAEICTDTVSVYSSTIFLPSKLDPGFSTPIVSYSTKKDCTSIFQFKLYDLNTTPACAAQLSPVYELAHPTVPNLGYLTANAAEVAALVNSGWTSKGAIGGVMPTARENAKSEIFHILHRESGTHTFTGQNSLLFTLLGPGYNPNGDRFYQQTSLGFIHEKMLFGEDGNSSAVKDQVCAEIKRWRDGAPSNEEADFWTSLVESKKADLSGFQRVIAIAGSYALAYDRGNTEEEWRFWDKQLIANSVDAAQMRRILLVDSAFQSICGRANSAVEFEAWNRYLIDNGDGRSALSKLRTLIQCN